MSTKVGVIGTGFPILATIAVTKSKDMSFPHKVDLAHYGYKTLQREYDKNQAENFLGLCNKTVASAVRLHYLDKTS